MRTPTKEADLPAHHPVYGFAPAGQVFRGKDKTYSLFLGPTGKYRWDYRDLRNYFFVIPYTDAPILTLRASQDITLGELLPYLLQYFHEVNRVRMTTPTLWLRGTKLELGDTLFRHPSNSLFLLTDQTQLPQELRDHQGKIRQCTLCNKSWGSSVHTPKGCNHTLLFQDQFPSRTVGNILDRKNQAKPWACPAGHLGASEAGDPVPGNILVPQPPGPPTPRPSTRPSPRTSGRGQAQPPPPPPGPPPPGPPPPGVARKSTAPPVHRQRRKKPPLTETEDSDDEEESPLPIRAAKAKAAQKLAAAPDPTTPEKEDISGSDDGSPGFQQERGGYGGDESGNEEEGDIDPYELLEEMEGQSDEEDSEDSACPPLQLSDTEDEADDDEEIRDIRRRNKGQLLGEIQGQLAVIEIRPSVYVADQEDKELIKKYIISPCLQGSHKWIKYGNRAPEEVIKLVMAGELPGRNSKVQTGLLTQTPVLYTRGLVDLLGLIQEEIIRAGGLGLVEGRLKLSQFFDINGENHLDLPDRIDHLLQMMSSPNKKSHALAGFVQLVDSLDLYASSPAAFAKFMIRYDFNS